VKFVRVAVAKLTPFINRKNEHEFNPLDSAEIPAIRTERLDLRPCGLSHVDELAAIFPTGHLGPRYPGQSSVPSWWRQLCLVNELTGYAVAWAIARRRTLG
jgi:hypothetical protein